MMKRCDAEGLRNRMDLAHLRACEKCVLEGGWVVGVAEGAGWCGTRKTLSWRLLGGAQDFSMEDLCRISQTQCTKHHRRFCLQRGFLLFCLVLFSFFFFQCDRSVFLSPFSQPLSFSPCQREMNVRLALVFAVASSLLGLACAEARCSAFADCASCAGSSADEGACVWVTDAQCKQKCVVDTSQAANSVSAFWRGDATSDSAKCSSHNSCLCFPHPLLHLSISPPPLFHR